MIERTFDVDLIKSIVLRPEVFATVASDGQAPEEFEPDMNECWLKVVDGDQVAGLYNFHVIDDHTLQVHPMILPESRGSIGHRSGKAALRWIVDNSHYSKVICEIPVIYRNVKLFAMKCGMVKTDIIERIYPKNGKLHDMWVLAITRPEIEAKCYE